jgi:2-dehydro-3-deoxy-D-gluconate 5-dehydrogenase
MKVTNKTIAQLFDLTGKNAIVTGGATGIGQAIALRLSEAGAGVMIADIDYKSATQTVSQIKDKGGKAHAIRADVCNSSDAKKVVQATKDTFGSLDILVNNAAIYPPSPTLQITEEMWEKVLNVNLKGVFLFCQAAAGEMIKAGHGGKIINIASESAVRPIGVLAHYEASKAAVVMFTKSLALEFGPYNIPVNAVAPGTIKTPGLEQELKFFPDPSGVGIEGMLQGLSAQLPLRRVGEADDIANVVLFLASAASNYMTGTLLLVDGGHTLI